MTSPTLPTLPSKLLHVALKDLLKCEAQPDRFEINMHAWHSPRPTSIGRGCVVCLAGSVMANTLRVADFKEMIPSDFDADTKWKLIAINYLREGRIGGALDCLGSVDESMKLRRFQLNSIYHLQAPPDDLCYPMPGYLPSHPAQFHKEARQFIKWLEDHGL